MNGAASQDDGGATAAADLVLLHQNLAKSKRVTTRMTALLTSFDDRLARLDKSVVPIHRSTKDLSKIQRNVESALLAIDAVLGTNDLLDREEEVLMRDPREDLAAYQASLTRLKSAMESMERSSSVGQANGLDGPATLNGKGKEREGTLGRVRSLIDLGCNNLGKVFFEYTESASPKSGWTDISQWDAGQGIPIPTLMPQSTVGSLVGLLAFLRTILGQDSPLEKELQKGYGDRRGMFIATTLNQVGREVVDGVEVQTRSTGFSSRLQAAGMRGFGRFLDTMFALLKSEHALAGAVFEKYQANRIYSFIVPPALTMFSGVGAQMNTAIKKTLTSNPTSVGIAFTCYIELTLPHRAEVFEDWIKNKAGRTGRQENELAQLSHAFRASCLRSLPEYIDEARQYGAKNNLTPQELVNVNVAPVSISTVSFVKQLTEYPDTVDGLLATLGDGNWMPSGKTANPANSRGGFTDEGYGLLSKYLGDVLETLLTSIDARGRNIGHVKNASHGPTSVLKKDMNASTSGGSQSHQARQASGLAAIYALNNVSYLRREVLLNSSVPDFLSSGAASRRASSSTAGGGMGGYSTNGLDIEDEMNRRNRSSRTAYLEIFSPLVSCLMDAGMEQSMLKSAIGVGNTEKKDTKDRFARFNDALEEVEHIHKLGKVDQSPENADFRARLKDEVVRMCVPTYTAFVRKHDNFSKNPSKYLKIDPQGLQSRLESLFE